jgi:hypothetical protein
VTFSGRVTLIRGGWPFAFALSLYFLLLAASSRFLHAVIAADTAGKRRFLLLVVYAGGLGCLLGVVFSLHAFVGLFAGLLLLLFALPLLVCWWSRRWLLLSSAGAAAFGFLLVAWPWLQMHLALREVLQHTNIHIFEPEPQSLGWIFLLGILMVLFYSILMLRGCLVPRNRILVSLCGLGALLVLVGMIPLINRFIAGATSTFMAGRLHYFMPGGLLVALLATPRKALVVQCRRWRVLSYVLLAAYAAASVPALYHQVKVTYYLGTTHDYDVHEYHDLLALQPFGLSGKTVLSDPFTSYFARRFLGCYTITVPAGHASPAVDYAERNRVWQSVLADPVAAIESGLSFDYVLINKRQRVAGYLIDSNLVTQGIRLWHEHGHMLYEDENLALFRVDEH